MNDTENIIGGRALDDLLQTLPVKLEKNIMRTALAAGARVYRDEAKKLVPKDSGDLAENIRVSTRTRKGRVTASAKVGGKFKGKIIRYAHLVEYGTRAHVIAPKKKKAVVTGDGVFKRVNHPGDKPKPFMRPAADASFAAAVAAVQAKIRQRLTKEGLEVPEAPQTDEVQE